MKKLIYFIILVSSVTACQVDESADLPALDQSLSTLVKIPSVKLYQKLADEHQVTGLRAYAGDEFIPLQTRVEETTGEARPEGWEVLPTEDDFLFQLLNEDLMVAIDQWAFRLDPAEEQVYVMALEQLNMEDLRNGNLRNPEVMVFSFEDEVLDLLQQGKKNGAQRTEWCDGVNTDEAKVFWNTKLEGSLRTNNTDCKYFKGGIYFSMTIRMTVEREVYNYFFGVKEWKVYENSSVRIEYPYSLQKKCDDMFCNDNGTVSDPYGGKVKRTFYSSINKLSDIEMTVRYYVTANGFGSYSSPLKSIDIKQWFELKNSCP